MDFSTSTNSLHIGTSFAATLEMRSILLTYRRARKRRRAKKDEEYFYALLQLPLDPPVPRKGRFREASVDTVGGVPAVLAGMAPKPPPRNGVIRRGESQEELEISPFEPN